MLLLNTTIHLKIWLLILRNIFETALILINVKGSAKKEAEKDVVGDYGIPTGKGLLYHLIECFGRDSMAIAAEPFLQFV